jgi:hypothetical protein
LQIAFGNFFDGFSRCAETLSRIEIIRSFLQHPSDRTGKRIFYIRPNVDLGDPAGDRLFELLVGQACAPMQGEIRIGKTGMNGFQTGEIKVRCAFVKTVFSNPCKSSRPLKLNAPMAYSLFFASCSN